MSVLLALAAIAVRVDGPALTPEEARHTPPAVLADMLLAAGHPPIDDAVWGYDMMLPPTPPGQPDSAMVQLFTVPMPSREAGFCERTRILVRFEPVVVARRPYPAVRPVSVSTDQLYRWNPGTTAATCSGDRRAWIEAKPLVFPRRLALANALSAVRALAEAQRRAGRHGSLSFDVTIDDQLGPMLADYDQRHPEQRRSNISIFTEGRAALRAIPFGSVRSIDDDEGFGLLRPGDLEQSGRTLRAVSLFAGDAWQVTVVLDGERVVHIHLRRAIPPPP